VSFTKRFNAKITTNELILLLRCSIYHLWEAQWFCLPMGYVSFYKLISPIIPNKAWFLNLDVSRIIYKYSSLRLGHYFLFKHAYYLELNSFTGYFFPICGCKGMRCVSLLSSYFVYLWSLIKIFIFNF